MYESFNENLEDKELVKVISLINRNFALFVRTAGFMKEDHQVIADIADAVHNINLLERKSFILLELDKYVKKVYDLQNRYGLQPLSILNTNMQIVKDYLNEQN